MTGWSVRRVVDLLYVLLVESMSSAWHAPMQVREQVDKYLADPSNLPKAARRRVARQDRKTWGLSAEAKAGARAMAALAPGPPGGIKKPES